MDHELQAAMADAATERLDEAAEVGVMTQLYAEDFPCDLAPDEIEALAESMSTRCGYTPSMGLQHLVDIFGGELKARDYQASRSKGSISIRTRGDFDIFLPTHTSAAEDRFTVAHELGHYVLHYLLPISRGDIQLGTPMEATRYGVGRSEDEANGFALAFLMSRDLASKYWAKCDGNVGTFASLMGVPLEAARLRAGVIVQGEELAA